MNTLVHEESNLINFVSQDLIDFNVTLDALLSASEELCHHFDAALSGIPIHPYERLKYDYLGNNFACISIDSVEVLPNFCPIAAVSDISAISVKYNETVDCQMRALTSNTTENECNVFAELSGDQFIIKHEKIANHLSFIEMVKNIPIQAIDANPELIAQKLISHYINTYQ